MFKFKSLRCPTCGSVVMNLPEAEVVKLDGAGIRCECCGHHNRLSGFDLTQMQAPLPTAYEWDAVLDG